MESILNLLTSNLAICLYEAAILVGVIVWWSKLRKKKKQCVEMDSVQREIARDERLNNVLQNELHQQKQEKIFQSNTPFDEVYHDQSRIGANQRSATKLQFTVQGELATRKYVILIIDEITIGKSEKNDLVLRDLNIAEKQCRIFVHEKELYIQTLDAEYPLSLKRKKEIMQIKQQTVEIKNKDIIEMGSTQIKIEMI